MKRVHAWSFTIMLTFMCIIAGCGSYTQDGGSQQQSGNSMQQGGGGTTQYVSPQNTYVAQINLPASVIPKLGQPISEITQGKPYPKDAPRLHWGRYWVTIGVGQDKQPRATEIGYQALLQDNHILDGIGNYCLTMFGPEKSNNAYIELQPAYYESKTLSNEFSADMFEGNPPGTFIVQESTNPEGNSYWVTACELKVGSLRNPDPIGP